MEQAALLLAAVSAVLSMVAILVSTGTAIRVSRLEGMGEPHEGLTAGSPAPRDAIAGIVPAGQESQWISGPSLIAFVSPSCEPCGQLVMRLNVIRDRLPQNMLFIEPELDGDKSLRPLAEFEAHWVNDASTPLRRAFKSFGTPHLFVIRDGLIQDQHLGADADRLFDSESHAGPDGRHSRAGEAAKVG